jgi:hypothetical protein
MPYSILIINISEEMFNELSDIAVYLMVISYFLNSGFNCIVYCIFGKFFRTDLKELFTGLLGSRTSLSSTVRDRNTTHAIVTICDTVEEHREQNSDNVNECKVYQRSVFENADIEGAVSDFDEETKCGIELRDLKVYANERQEETYSYNF